jgi:hypothetical protein
MAFLTGELVFSQSAIGRAVQDRFSRRLPAGCNEGAPFREAVRAVLSADYKVVVRYLTPIAWLVERARETIDVALSVEPYARNEREGTIKPRNNGGVLLCLPARS